MTTTLDQDILQGRVSVSDVHQMFLQSTKANATPYETQLVEVYNEQVDEWVDKVLTSICDSSGNLVAGTIPECWNRYFAGLTIRRYMATPESVMKRADIQSIETLFNILYKT